MKSNLNPRIFKQIITESGDDSAAAEALNELLTHEAEAGRSVYKEVYRKIIKHYAEGLADENK